MSKLDEMIARCEAASAFSENHGWSNDETVVDELLPLAVAFRTVGEALRGVAVRPETWAYYVEPAAAMKEALALVDAWLGDSNG